MNPRAQARVRAPEFPSGSWINSSSPLTLKHLRGKIVLLDFWTFCCANCLHVIDELRALEHDYADVLVIIGVHSPKFEHEKSDRAVAAAAERYRVAHAVFNDPELYLWRQYAVRAWPTLVLVDPAGYVVAQAAGEGQTSALRVLIDQLIASHDAAGTLRRGENPYVAPPNGGGTFRFPAKAIRSGDSLFVADTGNDQIVQTELDGTTVRQRFGADVLREPNGLTIAGNELVVADTANHRLVCFELSGCTRHRVVDLNQALAATSTVTGAIPSVLSPWDVCWWPARECVVIAAAGVHLLLGWFPATEAVRILAGTTVEGLKDGPAVDGWLAQPSGLAVDGDRMWFADSETSALRYLTADGELHTAIGEGLFDFGHVDGPARNARLQHPLGVAMLPDGSVAIADTYNGAVRRYDASADAVTTIASGLAEPSGLVVVEGELLVVESGAHEVVRVPHTLAASVDGDAMRTERPVTELAAGRVELRVVFDVPAGRKLDDRYGPSTRLTVSASAPELLVSGAGDSTELERVLTFEAAAGTEAVLHITAQAASCDDEGDAEHAACYLARQDWGVPIRLVAAGDTRLDLMLLG